MSTAELDARRGTKAKVVSEISWTRFSEEPAYECRAVFIPEEEGGYSVHCGNLRGVISQGETLEEAIENIADAFRETVLYYLSANEEIPWGEVETERPKGALDRWILVKCGR